MISSKLKIVLLLLGHVVALPFFVSAVRKTVPLFPREFYVGLLPLVFAQAGLLGIWGALSTTRSGWRFPAVLTTTTCLAAVAVTAERSWPNFAAEMFLLVALTTAVIFVALSVLRFGRLKLRLAHLGASPATAERFHSTLRHLFLATTFVVVLAIGTMSVAANAFAVRGWDTMLIVAVVSPFLIVVELATLWGTLGFGAPAIRLVVILPSAFLLGLVPPFLFQPILESEWEDFMNWSAIFGLQAMITAASLLVVRSCGWRLVSGEGNTAPPQA